MPEENDPPQPQPAPDEPTLLGASSDEMFARALQTVKMTSVGGGTWQPPTIEETARLFPGYELLKLLGRGGMGAVYQARQIDLDRLVAIKLLPLEISVDQGFVDRFRREARAMAKLHHPNIITVFEFGQTREGHLFFVMEYVEGANLADVIRQVGLNGEQVLSIAEQVCTALAYAHGKGVVHRDIKPANVMIDTESHVKVADFGLARVIDAGPDAGTTMTGTIMGTPDYMAPEQMKGMNVDHRADIYSLGVMLYEMLCREVPKGIFQTPSHRTGCDPRIDAIVIKAMQQAPDHRYQSTQEMKADVIAARTPLVPATLPPGDSTREVHPRPVEKPALPEPNAAVMEAIVPPVGAKKSKLPRYAGIAAILFVSAAGAFYFHGRSKLKPATAADGAPAAHPADALAFGGHFYKYFPEKGLTWQVARQRAEAMGGYLVTVTSEEEHLWLKEMMKAHLVVTNQSSWTGGMCDGPEKPWRWVTAEPFDYQAWPPDRPNFSGKLGPAEPYYLGYVFKPDGIRWDDVGISEGAGNEQNMGFLVEWGEFGPGASPATTTSAPLELGAVRLWSKQDDLPKRAGVSWEDSALKLSHGGVTEETSRSRDLILRASVRANPDGEAQQMQIRTGPAYYRLETLPSTLRAALYFVDSKRTEILVGAWSLPRSYETREYVSFELRAIGDTFTVTADRQELGTVQHQGTRDAGGVGLYAKANGYFRDIVYLPLDKAGDEKGAPSTPATASKDAPFVNTLGMKFVPVPGTTVLFSVWETRVQDWLKFEQTTTKTRKPLVAQDLGPTHPMTFMSWENAHDFCAWLTDRERKQGLIGPQQEYRLPTDAEWSVAVGLPEEKGTSPYEKGGTFANEDLYPWGTSWPPPKGAGNYWRELDVDEYKTTSPVGSFAPNQFGLYDMGGNVNEWCEDKFGEPGKENFRVQRGAHYGASSPNLARSSYREPGRTGSEHEGISSVDGFRIVLAPAPPAEANTPAIPATPAPMKATPAATPVASPHTPAPATPTPLAPATPSSSPTPVAPASKPQSEVEKWLAEVEALQQAAWQKDVVKPYEASVAALRAKHSAALDDAFAKATKAGDLKQSVIWRDERQAFEAKYNVVAQDEPGVLSALRTLRASFRQQLASIEANRAIRAKALHAQYDFTLAQNQTALVQNKRIPEAQLVEARRAEIAKAWLGVDASAKATTAAPIPPLPIASKDLPWLNSLGMRFVPVPITGGPSKGQRVLFSIWETRVQDYERFQQATKREWPPAGFKQLPTHPAVQVSWEDAVAFCEWLTEQERKAGRLALQHRYRLPTDLEWSCAVGIEDREDDRATPAEKQGKVPGVFPWAGSYPPPRGAANLADQALKNSKVKQDVLGSYDDGHAWTSPVGSFPANALGLCDLGGNVREWCEDWLDAARTRRVTRGASWYHGPAEVELWSSRREDGYPAGRSGLIGFRIVLAVDSSTAPATPAAATPPPPPPSAATPAPVADNSFLLASKDRPLVNGLGMKFVPVPISGGPTDKKRVLFSIWETRVRDYEVFARETGTVWPPQTFQQEPTHPAGNVSWLDTQAFCQWLTERERQAGRLRPAERYRLPTDHEWSCAIGSKEREDAKDTPITKSGRFRESYPWGTAWPPPRGAGNYFGEECLGAGAPGGLYLKGYRDDFASTAPVGSFPANKLGLYDLGGNLWEWCDDLVAPDRPGTRVTRGASYLIHERGPMWWSARVDRAEAARQASVGFRVVLANTP